MEGARPSQLGWRSGLMTRPLPVSRKPTDHNMSQAVLVGTVRSYKRIMIMKAASYSRVSTANGPDPTRLLRKVSPKNRQRLAAVPNTRANSVGAEKLIRISLFSEVEREALKPIAFPSMQLT